MTVTVTDCCMYCTWFRWFPSVRRRSYKADSPIIASAQFRILNGEKIGYICHKKKTYFSFLLYCAATHSATEDYLEAAEN